MGLFGRHKHKTPPELVQKLCNALSALKAAREQQQDGQPVPQKVSDDVAKYLGKMRVAMFGDKSDTSAHAPTEAARHEFAVQSNEKELVDLLIVLLPFIDFEVRKDAEACICHMARHGELQQHCLEHPSLITTIVRGYENVEVALTYGAMLRDMMCEEAFAKYILESELLYSFLDYVRLPDFEVASDAFLTFRDLLTKHDVMVNSFLSSNSESFFESYNQLLTCDNYATRRQALKLLGQVMMNRTNMEVMLKYVSEVKHLMLIMNLLRDSSRSIQFEAFHVFKVFVANPNKPPEVLQILVGNRDKLLQFLANFQPDRKDDQFLEEKAIITRLLSALELAKPASPPPPPSAAADESC